MTIQEALDRVDLLRPNYQDINMKIRWLSELDGLIYREIISNHAPEGVVVNVADETQADAADWDKTMEIRVPKVQAGVNPHMDVVNGDDLTRVKMDGKLHTLSLPVIEAIKSLREMRMNGYAVAGKRRYEIEEDTEFTGYTVDTDRGTELLAPFPYDEIYTHYLMAKVDDNNLEWDKYNNDMLKFNNSYDTLSDWWTRTHLPKQRSRELRI